MSESGAIASRNIRWQILAILHETRLAGKSEPGGWLALAVLRKLLDLEGHPLSEHALRDYCQYLDDDEINCLDVKKIGVSAPYAYKYRITAKGVRAVEYEEKVPGVGIYSAKSEAAE